MKNYKIMIIAGEKSGDIHGANLVNEIKKLSSDITFDGVGGDRLAEAGVKLMYNMTDLAVLGASEIIRKFSQFYAILKDIVSTLKKEHFDAVILIDFPGFNLRLAERIRKLGIPIIYYISPQVWAWRKKRVNLITELVDKMIVILPFEKKCYQNVNIDVDFVGHPLLDSIKVSHTKEELKKEFNIKGNIPLIGLLPGSRENEISRILPVMMESAALITKSIPEARFIIPAATPMLKKKIKDITYQYPIKPLVCQDYSHEIMKAADLVLVASGSATLETAFFTTPMIIIYKVSFLTWILAKMLVKIPHIGLVNIVAGSEIAPEFIQHNAKTDVIAKNAVVLLTDKAQREKVKKELGLVKEKLGSPGASTRAAKIVLEMIEKQS